MFISRYYCVGGHSYSICMDEGDGLWECMEENYGPFSIAEDIGSVFSLCVEELPFDIQRTRLIFSDQTVKSDFLRFTISETTNGLLFELQLPSSNIVNAWLLVDPQLRARVYLSGSLHQRFMVFNSVAQLCFLMATIDKRTVLMHASAVIADSKAYLFLGKSGTGKSTHSKLWHRLNPETVLLNDDHPVIRVLEDGRVMAYGSPWSGKTHCYKNLSIEVGGIVRIQQAQLNRIMRLKIIESYASLMTSCSGLTWMRGFADDKDRTIQLLIQHVPCWKLECLPNEEAAELCMKTLIS